MVVLLTIRVKCSCLRAKAAKVSGHLPAISKLGRVNNEALRLVGQMDQVVSAVAATTP